MEQEICKICILGYQRLTEIVKKAVSTLSLPNAEITVADCNINDLPDVIREQQRLGCDIFIAGSGNAAEFRRVFQMPLVELELSDLDYLSGLHKALALGTRPAFVKHKYAPDIPAARFSGILGKEVPVFSYEDAFELQQIVMREDIDVVIGATYSVEIATSLGKAGVLISPSVETIQNAIRQAYRRVENQRRYTEQQRIINGIIAQPNVGIIVAGRDGKITIFNAVAQTLTGILRGQAMGRPIADLLLPLTDLPSSPEPGGYREGVRLLNGAMVRCRERSLELKGEVFATLYFLDIDNRRRKPAQRNARTKRGSWEEVVAGVETMTACVSQAQRLARLSDSICILGEPYTGRLFLAECIFNASDRSEAPLMILDFSLIPPENTLPYLLGVEDTNGVICGALELANGGGVIVRHYQSATSEGRRVIENIAAQKPLYRVNGRAPVSLDIRFLVVATPEEEMLLSTQYHLSTFSLFVPPLRDRRADIPALFIRRATQLRELSAAGAKRFVTPEMADILRSYAWPGNLAELDRAVRRYLALLDQMSHAALRGREKLLIQAIGERELLRNYMEEHPILTGTPTPDQLPDYRTALEDMKRLYHMNNTQAAEVLGISRVTLWRYLNPAERGEGESFH